MLSKSLSDSLSSTPDTKKEYENEVEKNRLSKTKYRDPDFFPSLHVLPEDKHIFVGASWDRVEKIYDQSFNVEMKNTEIRRGTLKDDALIAVLSAMLKSSDKILPWFSDSIDVASGIICVNIPFRGEVVAVIVDTKVPRAEGRPVLSRPQNNGFPWCCFIEKALAKLLGSFSSLEKLPIKELLFDFFNYTSKTILSPSISDRYIEELALMMKQGSVALVTIGICKESEQTGLWPGSTYILQQINKTTGLYVLLYNPGVKRKYVSTFEERLDFWRQEARFNKVKECNFVLRSIALQKYTQSLVVGSPDSTVEFSTNIVANIEEGDTFCKKQFSLRTDKFININFIVESSSNMLHEINIMEDERLKNRLSTRDSIDFFSYRADPEKAYVISLGAEKATQITLLLKSEYKFTLEEQSYMPNPLQKVGTSELICGKTDGRSPEFPSNVACLPQWSLKLSKPGSITIRIINKTICESRHFFFLAKTNGERLRFKGDFFYNEHVIEGSANSDEWTINISDISSDYVFGCYRNIANIDTSFDFEILGNDPIEMNPLESFNDTMNNVKLDDKISPSKNDLRSPLRGTPGVILLRQYILAVEHPGKVFITFDHGEGKHSVSIQRGIQRINHFGNEENYYFESPNIYDTFEFNAQADKYAVCVTRELLKTTTDYMAIFYSRSEISLKKMPVIRTEKNHVFSRDIKFQENDLESCYPFETSDSPLKQFYLIVPEPMVLIGNLETNSTQDDGTYYFYIEDNGGKLLNGVNITNDSEHAICTSEGREWFTFNIKCDPEFGTVLTFCVTRKGAPRRSSVVVHFYSKTELNITTAQADLADDIKKDLVAKIRESEHNKSVIAGKSGDISTEFTKLSKETEIPQQKNSFKSNLQINSSCCQIT